MTRSRRRPGQRPAARPRAGRLLAAAAALLAVGAGMLPAAAAAPITTSAAASAAASTAVAPSTAQESGKDDEPGLTLRQLTPAIARPGDELSVTVQVTNPTDHVLSGARVDLWINWKPLYSRSALADWVGGNGSQTSKPHGTTGVEDLAPGESREVTVLVPVHGLGFEGAPRGPRELAVTLRQDRQDLSEVRTFFLWDDDAAGTQDADPVRLSLLAPVTGPPVDPADVLDTRHLAGPTSPGGTLARVLAAVGTAEHASGTHGALALAVDPALVATAAASDDGQVAAWGQEMTDLGGRTDVSPLPPYDPDLGALARAGLGRSSLHAATHAPLPDGWKVPASWRSPLAWPAGPGAPDATTLDAAAAAGLTTAVVSPGLAPRRGTVTGLARVGTPDGDVTALVADPPLSQTLAAGTDLQGGSSSLSQPELVQRILAETAVVSSQGNGSEPHLLVTMPRGWSPDLDALGAVLSALSTSGWVRIAPLTELQAATVPTVDRAPLADSKPQDGELDAESVRRLEAAREAVTELSGVAAEPAALLSTVAPGLVAPTSVAWRARPEDRATAVGEAVDAAATLRGGLSVTVNQEVTLISAAGALPVTVRNDLPTDATVTVALRPDDPRLVVDKRPTVPVAAGTEVRVMVPVRALASGDIAVEIRVLTPDGATVGTPAHLQLRVRAGWETAGTAVLAALVALFFVAGVYRTVKRGRSARRATDDALVDPTIPADVGRS